MKKRIVSIALATFLLLTIASPLSAIANDTTLKITTTWDGERYVDTMDYKFIPDDEAVGDWVVCDFVDTIDKFNPAHQSWNISDVYYIGNRFYEDGTMLAYFSDTANTSDAFAVQQWTKGYIMQGGVIPSYEIRQIGGYTYMFVQWKSGSYSIWGLTPSYYVFIKTSDESTTMEEPESLIHLRDEVYNEYEQWSSVPAEKRDLPKNMKVPFRVMWLIYTDAVYNGTQYLMTESQIQKIFNNMKLFEERVERVTSNNVDIINEYTLVSRQINFNDAAAKDSVYGGSWLSPKLAQPELENYAPPSEYNFVFSTSAFDTALSGGPHGRCGGYVTAGQGYACHTLYENGGWGGALHEMLHAFEFGRTPSFLSGIEMPWVHAISVGTNGESPELYPGYEGYFIGGEFNDELLDDFRGQSGWETLVGWAYNDKFLQADIQYVNPKTKEIKYVGIYPSMWKYVVEWQAFLATVPKLDTTPLPAPTRPEAPNLDTAHDWARNGIQNAVQNGYVPADLQNYYTSVITRAEFCRLTVKWMEYKTGKNIDAILSEKKLTRRQNAFSDTTNPDILAAFALGIISGEVKPTDTTPGVFNPGGQFNRQQAATMIRNLWNALGSDTSNTKDAGFVDIGDAEGWARDAINFCSNNGIMNGTGSMAFSPKTTFTREESILMFNNIK